MISARDPGNFGGSNDGNEADRADMLIGPLFICLSLFVAILANFILRVQESKRVTGVNPMSFQYAWQQSGTRS